MKANCHKCRYYCWDNLTDSQNDPIYDFSRSFCALHGCAEILDPNCPPNLSNSRYFPEFDCFCGFWPFQNFVPVQLTLF